MEKEGKNTLYQEISDFNMCLKQRVYQQPAFIH